MPVDAGRVDIQMRHEAQADQPGGEVDLPVQPRGGEQRERRSRDGGACRPRHKESKHVLFILPDDIS